MLLDCLQRYGVHQPVLKQERNKGRRNIKHIKHRDEYDKESDTYSSVHAFRNVDPKLTFSRGKLRAVNRLHQPLPRGSNAANPTRPQSRGPLKLVF
jgi:hypothetical protein